MIAETVIEIGPESIEALAAAIVHKQEFASAPIVTVSEAVELTRTKSVRAFYRWAKRMKVSAHLPGRYSREKLLNALHREGAKA